MTATLSQTDKFYHGLRILPSYDELLQGSKKPLHIPVPDRSSKWFGLSNYRSLMLDAAKKYNDYEHLALDYDGSGAHLPQRAAMVAPAEQDEEVWGNIASYTQRLQDHNEYKVAAEMVRAEKRQKAAALRAQHLATYAPMAGHWTIDAHHKELEAAGVEHDAPVVRPKLTRTRLPEPLGLPVEAGHLGKLRPFPTFEELNYGQPSRWNAGHARTPSSSSYERLREQAQPQG